LWVRASPLSIPDFNKLLLDVRDVWTNNIPYGAFSFSLSSPSLSLSLFGGGFVFRWLALLL